MNESQLYGGLYRVKMNGTIRVSIVLLVAGILLSTQTTGLGLTEWTILAGFVVLGFIAGLIQAFVIVRARQGQISSLRRTLYVILSIVVLVFIKGVITSIVASNLGNAGISLYMQICFSIFGMFLARGLVTAALDKSPSRSAG